MGKASSSKKVARAARAGGHTSGPRRQLGYPIAVAAILVVGVLVVVFARSENQEAAAVSPTVGEHWHTAYGVYVCDAFLPALTDQVTDTTGLHTHGDGIAHIHPFLGAASGRNATLSKWGETTGLSFSGDGFTVDGTTYEPGFDCDGQPAEISLHVWSIDDLEGEGRVLTGSDIAGYRFVNREAITLAVAPAGTEVPPPPSAADVDRLDPTTDEEVDPTATTSTAPGAEGTSDSTDTTIADESTTTTAAP
jgi:hypothetical protein